MELIKAKDIALGVWNKLKPHCDIIKIAGSIRREKPEVGDIEIVALPKTINDYTLFGDPIKKRIAGWRDEVYGLGKVIKGSAWGKYIQVHLSEHDIDVDIFMPDDFDYWRQLAIRTGSADWTGRFIAGGWRKLGWCGSDVGLRLQSQCEGKEGPDKKIHWKCIAPVSQQTLPPHWESEQEFFDWLGLKWIEPKFRNI